LPLIEIEYLKFVDANKYMNPKSTSAYASPNKYQPIILLKMT
jgi:hypothetical protein